MRHCAHPAPKATTALEAPLYPQNASTYRRTALLARPRLKSQKQARTQTPSAQQRSRAKKAITVRADVASSVHQDRIVPLVLPITSSSVRAYTQMKIKPMQHFASQDTTARTASSINAQETILANPTTSPLTSAMARAAPSYLPMTIIHTAFL